MSNQGGIRRVLTRVLPASALFLTSLAWVATGASGPTRVLATSGSAPARPPCAATAFRTRDFSTPTAIDNRWLPLEPGARYVLEGQADRGQGEGAHRVVLSVTDLAKSIDGVRSLVVWDNDEQAGELVESELAFFAQDDRGNVWGVGEYPEEYENGSLVGAPSTWIAGLNGARPGLAMPGSPRLGSGWYLQGWVPAIDFLDCAKVFKVGQHRCVPAGCFGDVLVIDERSPLEPDSGSQRKDYAAGVGNVRISAVGDKQGETLALVERRQLDSAELAAVRRAVQQMDRRARGVSDVYAATAPLGPLTSP
jgi:hypothetical protein